LAYCGRAIVALVNKKTFKYSHKKTEEEKQNARDDQHIKTRSQKTSKQKPEKIERGRRQHLHAFLSSGRL
jgi:hypothetical protein